ncbi:MAG: hypothetical protein ACR2RA_11440, partial [Geminicoccaceae bacterium]
FAAFAFLAAMVVIPLVLGYVFLWWLLHYTNTGLLVFKEEVAAAAPAETDGREAGKVLQCSYFTGSQVLLREFSSESDASNQEASPAVRCPWRIEVS